MSTYQIPPPPHHPSLPPPSPPVVPGSRAGRRSRALIVGLVAAALGFVEISFSSWHSVNGVVTDCTYFNLAPWVFGPLALACGVRALTRSGRAGAATAGRQRMLGGLCVALGALHLLRAFEVVEVMSGSPC